MHYGVTPLSTEEAEQIAASRPDCANFGLEAQALFNEGLLNKVSAPKVSRRDRSGQGPKTKGKKPR